MRALIRALRLSSSLLRPPFNAASGERLLSSPPPPSFLSWEEIAKPVSPFWSRIQFLSSTADAHLEYEKDHLLDDDVATKKDSSLNFALSQLACDFDRESNLTLNRFFCTRYTSVISTGSVKLDQALGIGGLPKGRMVEIFGKEACGKTTLALHIIREAQKSGGCCAYIDAENAFNPYFAEDIGVDTEKLLITHPVCAESSLSIVNTLINTESVDVIVVDSVAALVPQAEICGTLDMNLEETQSLLMTKALRKIQCSLGRSRCIVIFVNQVREKPKSYLSAEEVTCGGNALKFYAAVRLRISRRGLIQTNDKVTGINIAVQVIKNKLSPAMKKAELEIGFGTGIRREAELLEMASVHGVIMREENGDGSYWINGDHFEDKYEAESYLARNSDICDELMCTLRKQLFEKAT
ncbi:DNA repair protein recA homolog 2, mitochondrial-like [Carex rostrata]